MSILAIDPGPKTGFAFWKSGWDRPESGVVVFSRKQGEYPELQVLRFRNWLEKMAARLPRAYVYEAPRAGAGNEAELDAGMAGWVVEEAVRRKADHLGVQNGKLTRWATGRRRVESEEMISRAEEQWGILPTDDREAVALLLLSFGIERLISPS
jgi:hypothetical protein